MADTLETIRQQKTMTTLANANELVTRVIRRVAGNDIANSINGSPLTNDVICSIVQNRYKNILEKTAVQR